MPLPYPTITISPKTHTVEEARQVLADEIGFMNLRASQAVAGRDFTDDDWNTVVLEEADMLLQDSQIVNYVVRLGRFSRPVKIRVWLQMSHSLNHLTLADFGRSDSFAGAILRDMAIMPGDTVVVVGPDGRTLNEVLTSQ